MANNGYLQIVKKSGVASNIPLLSQAINIIEKYKAHPK